VKAPDFSTRRRGPGRTWDVTVVAAGLLALVASAYAASAAWADLRQARRASSEALREVGELAPRTRALAERLARGGRGAAAQAALTLDAPPRRVVAELTRVLPGDVRLLELSLEYRERVEVQARVEARTPEAYDRFLERLHASPAFEDVVPGAEKREEPLRGSLQMVYREEARR
jgi:hypothetical protein